MLIDEPQLSFTRGRPTSRISQSEQYLLLWGYLEGMSSFDGKSGDRQELRDLHNLFMKTLDAKLLAPSSIEGRFANLCCRYAEFVTESLVLSAEQSVSKGMGA
jgi:hypothetical protein